MGRYGTDNALEDIDKTVELIEDLRDNYPGIYERGEEYLSDVHEKLLSVRETIEGNDNVSPKQRSAIDNWGSGVRNWHPDYRD